MKTRILSLVACFFLLASAITFAAPGGQMVHGTLVAFTESTLTLAYAGPTGAMATKTWIIDGETIVKRLDQVMPWLDVARKGLHTVVEVHGDFVHGVQVPFYALETQGYGASTSKANMYSVTDIRENSTDSNLTAASERKDGNGWLVSKVEVLPLEPETDNAWALAKPTQIMIGNIDVIDGSVKIKLDGMFLNVAYGVDGKGVFFDPAGTSCVVDKTKGVTTINFDQELGKSFDEVAPRLELSFQKKMMIQKTTEVTYLDLDPAALVEVNGQTSSIYDATSIANFWLVRCNTDNRMIHVDAYMVGREAVAVGVYGKQLIARVGTGMVSIPLSEGLTVLTSSGAGSVADIVRGAKIAITTEPAEAYRAVLVTVTK